jgi:hypothetical protein
LIAAASSAQNSIPIPIVVLKSSRSGALPFAA